MKNRLSIAIVATMLFAINLSTYVLASGPIVTCAIEGYREGSIFDERVFNRSTYDYYDYAGKLSWGLSLEHCINKAKQDLTQRDVDKVVMTFESLFPTKIEAEISFEK